jgi:hypothetical protein
MRQEVDSLISAIGGLLFAEISSLWLPASVGWPARIVAAVGFVAVLWYAVFRRRPPAYSPWTGVAAGLVLLGFAAATARVRDTKTPTGGRVGAR